MDKKSMTHSKFDIYLGKNRLTQIKQIYGSNSKIKLNAKRNNFNNLSNLNSTGKISKSNLNDQTSYSLPKILEQYNKDFSHLSQQKRNNFGNVTNFINITGNNSYSVTSTDGEIDRK